jgi:hypothetical protein
MGDHFLGEYEFRVSDRCKQTIEVSILNSMNIVHCMLERGHDCLCTGKATYEGYSIIVSWKWRKDRMLSAEVENHG